MSEAKAPEQSVAGTQLAKMDPEMQEKISKLLMRRQSTKAKQMEIKRRELAETTLFVEVLLEKLNAPDADPLSPEYMKLLNTVNCMTALATVKGLEYLCDCNSYRESVVITDKKTGEKVRGYTRYTVADIMDKIGHVLGSSDSSMHSNLEIVVEMLSDIGCEMKAFKDEHGVFNPKKYEVDDDKEKAGEAEFDEDSAASEKDLEKVKEAVKAKAKRGA